MVARIEAPAARIPRTTPDPERQRLARQYHRAGRRLYSSSRPVVPVALLVLWASGWSANLDATMSARLSYAWLVVAAYGLALGVLLLLLGLPASIYGGFLLPRKYGLMRQSLRGWIADAMKGLALGAVLGVIALEGLYWLLRHAGALWWPLAGLSAFCLSLLLGALAPVVIAPVFYRFDPLPDGELARRLRALVSRSRLRVQGLYRFDLSRKWSGANAAVFGFGPTRRIVVADSMLDDYPPEGVEAVVGHELGHHAHGDLWVLSIAGGLATLLSLFGVEIVAGAGLLGLDRFRLMRAGSLPAILLLAGVVQAALRPALLALSRRAERRADAFAVRITGRMVWLVDSLVRLGDENLSELDPPRWEVVLRFSHPPLRERLEYLSAPAPSQSS